MNTSRPVPIIPAMSPADTLSRAEIDQFLQGGKIPLKLGTIDQHGEPNIHPLWYHYENGRLYLITATSSKKMKNIIDKDLVYFCVDSETRPYKGVKGKGTIAKVTDGDKAVNLAEKIITRYMGGVDNPLGESLVRRLREGKETLLEIAPRYYSVWDDSKSP